MRIKIQCLKYVHNCHCMDQYTEKGNLDGIGITIEIT